MFVASIPLYNCLAFSTIAWLASIVAPSPAVLAQEYIALQRLTRGPWQAIPSALLKHLKGQIGLPVQAHCIYNTSIAARDEPP